MDIPPVLSGNFGELRANRFHVGIDFKTEGREDIPIKSIWEGYVSRISVSPYGYGRAIYVDHPNGMTSVYGHANRFAPAIETAVRDSQYTQQLFPVDLRFTKGQFPVKQGQLIAYSGNTGSSAGPHLHFEIRKTETEELIDPLIYYKEYIKDTRPPEIRGVLFLPQEGRGVVNESTANQSYKITAPEGGKAANTVSVTAWGQIGVGVASYDRMTNTQNIYGVREVILKVDGDTTFHSIIGRVSFKELRYQNSLIAWDEWRNNGTFYMKSFVDPGNRLRAYQQKESGLLLIKEERAYRCEYILKDIYGNTSRMYFTIQGKESVIPKRPAKEVTFPWYMDNAYHDKGVSLDIPLVNLYETIHFDVDVLPGSSAYAPLYVIGKPVPLHTLCKLKLTITNDTYPGKSRYGVVQLDGARPRWIGGTYADGKMQAQIRELGSFSILVDDTAPVITPQNKTAWSKNRRVSFRITDDLSGISSWTATLDGEFILFEYDAKRNHLFYTLDTTRRKSLFGNLHLTVIDAAGNRAEYTSSVR